MKVTLDDIAKKTGLSKSTVSRAVNNTGPVNEQTRMLVERAIQDLGYIRKNVKKEKDTPASKMILVLSTDMNEKMHIRYFKAFNHFFRERGYMVCALDCNFSLQNELNYLEFASQNNFYGVFLLSLLHEGDADYYKKLASFSCPIVMVNRQYSSPDFDAVCVDYYQAGSIACGHLIDHGHRRIAFLSGPKELASTRNKVWGAADALAAHGIDFDSKNIEYTVHADYHDGYVCGEKLAQNKDEFSAVFCTNSPLACGLADALKSFNVKVPDDISIICTDNSPMRQGSPDITTVANDESDIANAAGQMLLDRILNPLLPKRRVVFPPTKISGGSVSQL